jgi:trehalose 6-phosphate synthase/phosphatase
MAQVIIISNRLPISVSKENDQLIFSPSIGGVATGLASYAEDPANRWVGWPGIASDELTSEDREAIIVELKQHNFYPIFLRSKEISAFYSGYSNSLLWPLFHNLPLKNIDQRRRQNWWQTYKRINQRFGETVESLAEDKSQIWIHDYQLLLLPNLLRSSGLHRNIGFFLHIPFPAPKTIQRLPEAKQLINGMLGADLVGFHTADYVHNFLESVKATRAGEVNDNHSIRLGDRIVRIAQFPMGIDYEKYAAASKSKTVKKIAKAYKKNYAGCKVIVSVDRLDPTKNLEGRLHAYEEFLHDNPQFRNKVIFVMVAAPSRTDLSVYAHLARRLEALAKSINQHYGSASWQPIDYIPEIQPFENVAALFSIADVAFIAPLRDGMNLSAKEFVASNHGRGVLILSETAGAAQELQDALIVNPRKQDSLVNALELALSMRKRELRSRLKRMQKDIAMNTVHHWAKTFVEALQQPFPAPRRMMHLLRGQQQEHLIKSYHQAKKRLLLLDYDGSLVPFTMNYEQASPPQSLLHLLGDLAADPANEIVIVSGRSDEELDNWFSGLPINLISEHGASFRNANRKTWKLVKPINTDWKSLLLPALQQYAEATPGARIEIKPHSIVWHYRAADPYFAAKNLVIIKRALKPLLKTYRLEMLQGNKILEIKNPQVSKAHAAQAWLNKPHDFILAIGDDTTDESLFTALPPDSFSVKVGHGHSAARFRLNSSQEVIALLEEIAYSQRD